MRFKKVVHIKKSAARYRKVEMRQSGVKGNLYVPSVGERKRATALSYPTSSISDSYLLLIKNAISSINTKLTAPNPGIM